MAAAVLAMYSVAPCVRAQVPERMHIPGAAFTVSRDTHYFGDPTGQTVQVDDVPGGRQFRAPAGALLVLSATVARPKNAAASLQAVTVHSRSSENGPAFHVLEWRQVLATSGYRLRNTTRPEWRFKPGWYVGPTSVVRLEVQFPIGFDSKIDPGSFLLTDVAVEFQRTLPKTTQAVTQPLGVRQGVPINRDR